jgi:hypothetical protein
MNWFADEYSNQLCSGIIHSDYDIPGAFPPDHHGFAASEQTDQSRQIKVLLCIAVGFHGGIGARAKELAAEGERHVDRRDVIHIRLQSILREERQRYLLYMDQVIQRIISARLVGSVQEPSQADLADAIDKALWLQSLFNLGETGNAFL